MNKFGSLDSLKSKIGLDDVYPKSTHVLLWIGSSIGIIIAACVFLVNMHHHKEYTTQIEFDRMIDSQLLMQQKLDSMSIDIRRQTKMIADFQTEVMNKWLPMPVR